MITDTILLISIILSFQSIFTIVWMLYAWENPKHIKQHKSPKIFVKPALSFTALVPARHEEKVIGDTIRGFANLAYPKNLIETFILCKSDDYQTINAAEEAIQGLPPENNIRLIIFDTSPINKPHALNVGLKSARNEIITVFDAEDEPHPDIYNVANSLFATEEIDVIQSGVQLMNYHSHWFSGMNVLEYFFRYKSGLQFFSRIGGVIPLAGNTFFIKSEWVRRVAGWDENSLTEDAEIGFRLSSKGAVMRVVYDETHATREETPDSLTGFIKQRTRWNQGFLQIFSDGTWTKVPRVSGKLITLYILTSPTFQALLICYAPFAFWSTFHFKLPIVIALISFIPLFLSVLQLIVNIVGASEFFKSYKQKHSVFSILSIILTFYPFQLLLMYSSFRAIFRLATNQTAWEKTTHVNAHRKGIVINPILGLEYA